MPDRGRPDGYNGVVRVRTIRVVLGLVLLTVSLALLLWSVWPSPRVTRTLEIQPAELSLPTVE